MSTPLGALTHRYLIGRVRQGDLQADTASNHWSALNILEAVHGRRPVEQLGRATILRWKEQRSHLKPSTQCSQWSYLSCFCDWLVDEQLLRSNPCAKIKAPKRPRTTPRALESDLVALVLEHAPDARARAVVWLEVGLGLRAVEIYRLRVEDWSRRDRLLRVTGKGRHQREVAVTVEAARALDAYLVEFPATVGPFIRSYTQPHRPLRPGTLSHWVSAWMLAAGVKQAPHDGVSGHALRHTAASDVLDNCDDLRVVQEMLGHAHLSSTSIYLRRAGLPKMRDAMEGRAYRRGAA